MLGGSGIENTIAGMANATARGERERRDDAAKIERRGGVDEELIAIDRAIEEHMLTIGNLLTRLDRAGVVMVEPPSSQTPGPPTPESNVCEMALRIRQLRRKVESLSTLAARVTARLDL